MRAFKQLVLVLEQLKPIWCWPGLTISETFWLENLQFQIVQRSSNELKMQNFVLHSKMHFTKMPSTRLQKRCQTIEWSDSKIFTTENTRIFIWQCSSKFLYRKLCDFHFSLTRKIILNKTKSWNKTLCERDFYSFWNHLRLIWCHSISFKISKIIHIRHFRRIHFRAIDWMKIGSSINLLTEIEWLENWTKHGNDTSKQISTKN